MKPYEKYVPSGVGWIGDIPDGWEVKRLKDIVSLYPKCNVDDKLSDDLVTFTPMECVKQGFFYNQLVEFENASSSYNFFQNNDILLAKVTPCFENGNIAIADNLSNGLGFGSSELFVLRCKDCITKYMFYYYQSDDFRQPAISTMYGAGGLKRVAVDFIQNNKLALPCDKEQQAIADYLDTETARIDNIIKAKEVLIERLKEKRTALISHAVTKGLDPNAKMKSSGVEWIGDIPEGWEVKKLKYLAQICNGQDYKEVEAFDGDFPVIGSGGAFARAEKFLYNKASVLLGRKGTIDCPLYVNQPFWTVDTMYYTDIDIKHHKKFFYYLCTTINFGLYQYGSTVPSMTQRDLKEIKFSVPNFDTQKSIADYLDTETQKIDSIIDKTKLSIEKLKEYRTAIISACVTGKIDVRNV